MTGACGRQRLHAEGVGAVTSAGSDIFGYDPVGNQTARPGGATVTYTPFDLPRSITQPSGTVTFGYDGDEQRIRKTTPDEETLYLSGLYERVTSNAAPAIHRYYVRSPERVVAVVTQGGAQAGTTYLHADHLGSVDVVTDADGNVLERRSYDPFGQRRNPVWGQAAPASFASTTTVGFTGHENDDELGLVNMKGRIYDPKVGRFLTPDPIVQAPLWGQSWNPYSYVWNNPLSLVDPSGFAPGDVVGEDGLLLGKVAELKVTPGEGWQMAQSLSHPMPHSPQPITGDGETKPTRMERDPSPTPNTSEAAAVRVKPAANDTATTGTNSGETIGARLGQAVAEGLWVCDPICAPLIRSYGGWVDGRHFGFGPRIAPITRYGAPLSSVPTSSTRATCSLVMATAARASRRNRALA